MARLHRLNRFAVPAAVALMACGGWLAFPPQQRWDAVNGARRTHPYFGVTSSAERTWSGHARLFVTGLDGEEIGITDRQACMCIALMTSFLWLPCFAPMLALLSGRVVRAEQKREASETPAIYTAVQPRQRRHRRRIPA